MIKLLLREFKNASRKKDFICNRFAQALSYCHRKESSQTNEILKRGTFTKYKLFGQVRLNFGQNRNSSVVAKARNLPNSKKIIKVHFEAVHVQAEQDLRGNCDTAIHLYLVL